VLIIPDTLNQKDGFTIVEILIVLAVIALLIVIIAPAAGKIVLDARATNVAQNVLAIKHAVEYYYLDERRLPESTSELYRKGYLNTRFSNDYVISFEGQINSSKPLMLVVTTPYDEINEALVASKGLKDAQIVNENEKLIIKMKIEEMNK
jgi:prepilin-type N-terminal cleavage/methylation domain-containing protein